MNNLRLKMLLHVCCANCLLHPYNVLRQTFDVTLFYYNPNIYPESEYNKRLAEIKRISGHFNIPLITGRYETGKWLKLAGHLGKEPEGGLRCSTCFEMRLSRTAAAARKYKFDIFASALSVSPHKNHTEINRIGGDVSLKYKIAYLATDFKKQDGFKKTTELSRNLDIYRQSYCGCIFSIKK